MCLEDSELPLDGIKGLLLPLDEVLKLSTMFRESSVITNRRRKPKEETSTPKGESKCFYTRHGDYISANSVIAIEGVVSGARKLSNALSNSNHSGLRI